MKANEGNNNQQPMVVSINKESIDSFSCLIDGEWQSGTWLKLSNLPNFFYFDEAILLCQKNENIWLAWIPDYGEILLHTVKLIDINF
jgi:hypothetical protein